MQGHRVTKTNVNGSTPLAGNSIYVGHSIAHPDRQIHVVSQVGREPLEVLVGQHPNIEGLTGRECELNESGTDAVGALLVNAYQFCFHHGAKEIMRAAYRMIEYLAHF
jgi:hypothetical protein